MALDGWISALKMINCQFYGHKLHNLLCFLALVVEFSGQQVSQLRFNVPPTTKSHTLWYLSFKVSSERPGKLGIDFTTSRLVDQCIMDCTTPSPFEFSV